MDEPLRPHTPPIRTAAPKRIYEIDGRDRLLLPMVLALGILCADLLVFSLWNTPALGITLLAAAWYAVYFWYAGAKQVFATRAGLLLFCAAALTALTFSLFSNPWLRAWNLLALPLLIILQVWEGSAATRAPCTVPAMAAERIVLAFGGLFGSAAAAGQAAASLKIRCGKRGLWILAGTLTASVLIAILLPLLSSADAFFQYVTSGASAWLALHVPGWVLRIVLGLCAVPFLFSLFYTLRRPRPRTVQGGYTPRGLTVDPIAPMIVLAALSMFYLFFLAVQFTALFGGERYLADAGISYAEYARSGFFQMVFAAVLNLSILLLCLWLCPAQGWGGRLVRILASLLVGLSAVLLVSAVWRMTLYVLAYGLSFKRLLTYWGMAVLAVLFAAALLAVWRTGFSFFRVLLVVVIVGWIALNFMNPDFTVAQYNVSLSLRSPLTQVDVDYMARQLSYDALPALEQLADARPEHSGCRRMIATRRSQARTDAERWESWSLSAQLAALNW